MTGIPAIALSLAMILGQPNDSGKIVRPRFETQFLCSLALAMAIPELRRFYLDPAKFDCMWEDGAWVVRG